MKYFIFLFISFFILMQKGFAQKSIEFYPINDLFLTGNKKCLADAFDQQITAQIKYIGLGEVSHGSRELFQVKTKMLQYLITEKGFRQIQFEYPNAAMALFNRYLLDSSLNEPAVLHVLYHKTFSNMIRDQSFLQFFIWLKQYNINHYNEKVSIAGFDLAGATGSLVNYFKARFNLEKTSAKALDTAKWRNEPVTVTANRIINYAAQHQTELQKGLGKEYLFFANAIKNAAWEIEFNKQYQTNTYKASLFRDSLMAVNILELNNDKTILWAHNLHITTGNKLSAGRFLKEKVGDSYYAILTDFATKADVLIWQGNSLQVKEIKSGKKTLASLLYRKYDITNGVIFKPELGKQNLTSGVGFIDRNGSYYNSTVNNAFDALIFFKTLNPVEY